MYKVPHLCRKPWDVMNNISMSLPRNVFTKKVSCKQSMNIVQSAFSDLLVRSCGVQCGSNETYTPSSPVAVRNIRNNQKNSNIFDATATSTSLKRSFHQATNKIETPYEKNNRTIMSQHDVIQFTESGSIVDEFDEQGKEFPEDMRSSSTVGTDPSVADSDSFADAVSDAVKSLPTLPSYHATETINKNCWSQPEVSIFQVRGPNYLTDKKKITSSSYLFPARGSDLYLADSTTNILMSKMSQVALEGQLRTKPTLAIIFNFPWGFMNLYFEIPAHLTKYMSESDDIQFDLDLSPSELATAKWLMADTEYRNTRLKLIPLVAEGPWAVRNLVTGRPALIGKKLPVSYELFPRNNVTGDAPLLTATLDIGNSSATAKRIVSICRRYMSALTLDVGFVIQSETQEELPEQMLGAVRVHGPDPMLAPKIGST